MQPKLDSPRFSIPLYRIFTLAEKSQIVVCRQSHQINNKINFSRAQLPSKRRWFAAFGPTDEEVRAILGDSENPQNPRKLRYRRTTNHASNRRVVQFP